MGFRRSIASLVLALGALTLNFSATAETPQAESSIPLAVEAAEDPWLTEEGPAVDKPAEVPTEQTLASWEAAAPTVHARAAALRRTRLELGLGDLPAPAAVVAAAATEEEPEAYSEMARELAPGVPAYQINHAFGLWESGDIGAAVLAFGRTAWSIVISLVAQLWLLENLSFLLMLVVLSASLAFILLAALNVCSHAAHDLGDLLRGSTPNFARYAALAALLLVPFAIGEGVLGFALALFTLAFVYGGPRQRNALAMAGILLVIGLHPIAQVTSIATHLVDHDPVAASVLRVLAGHDNSADVALLESSSKEDLVAAHALAYRDRRLGLVESSRTRLEDITARFPSDIVALANLGNIEKRSGENAAAIDYYERAAAQEDDPTLLFDLSQAYASAFRMEEYEATLAKAQAVDDRAVAALSSLGDAELVADLGFPMSLLTDRLLTLALSSDVREGPIDVLAPGRLGEVWYVTAGAFALVALFSLLFAHRWDHASLCGRCGHRICTRCEETVWSEEVCDDCHHLFQYPEATDPSLRMARLQALSEREVRFDRIWLMLSLLVPGLAGFAARRPDLAMFGLLLASWFAAWIVWPRGVIEDPMLMGSAAMLLFAIPGVLVGIFYVSVVILSLIVRKSR